MGHSFRARVGLSLGRVMFRVKWHFGSVQFGSTSARVSFISTDFLVQYACHTKISNFVENSGRVLLEFFKNKIKVAGFYSAYLKRWISMVPLQVYPPYPILPVKRWMSVVPLQDLPALPYPFLVHFQAWSFLYIRRSEITITGIKKKKSMWVTAVSLSINLWENLETHTCFTK